MHDDDDPYGPPRKPTTMEVAEPWIAALLANDHGSLNELLATSEAVIRKALLAITKRHENTTLDDYETPLYGLTEVNGVLNKRLAGLSWIVADAIREIAAHTGETPEAVLKRLAERHADRD
jgi:hypothetical protein